MARRRQPRNAAPGRQQGPGPEPFKPFGRRRGGGKENAAPWLDGSSANASSTSLSKPGARAHTFADTARNTAQTRRGFPGQDSKLRHKPVSFVSAGIMDPLKELEKDLQAEKRQESPVEQKQASPIACNPKPEPEPEPTQELLLPDPGGAGAGATPQNVQSDKAPLDPKLNPDHVNTVTRQPVRSPEPPLFTVDLKGDKTLRPVPEPVDASPDRHMADQESDSSEEVILFKGRDALRNKPRAVESVTIQQSKVDSQQSKVDSMKLDEMNVEIKAVEETMKRGAAPPENSSRQDPKVDLEADTILFNEKPPRQRKAGRRHRAATESDEDAALIADYIANMNAQDDDEDEDELEAHPGLGSHAFHMLRDLGGTDSDAIPEVISADEDTDERLARLLEKQEQLGLGSDEVMLYDGADSGDDDGWQVATQTGPRRKKGSSKTARVIQQKGQFPSATRMAEAFDDLDLMDWPLKEFKKASNVPHVSDSELEEAMQMSFQKDRLKKAEKKKQREALRAQGLLGKNVNPDDLRVKYPAGLRNDDLEYELEQFLLGDDEQLILPPIDKAARRLVHMTANKLGIKTQSAGKGSSRYPVLYRTKRTIQYDEKRFMAATRSLLKQSYFPRVDVDGAVASAFKSGKPFMRSANAVSYRDGDVVGQHAAELSSENKGRMLLEKMGWSKGMSLGTEDNQGITVPIVHVVKKTKAGLGE